MKVLLIAYGMDTVYTDLAKALSTRCDLHLITSIEHKKSGYSENFDLLKMEKISMHYVGSKSLFPVLTPWKLLSRVRKISPEVIHLPGGKPRGLPFLYPFLKRVAPLVVTIHEPRPTKYDPLLRAWKKRFEASLSLKYADCIIVTGESVKKEIEKTGFPENRTFSVPLGAFKTRLRWMSTKIGEEKNTVLFHGHISPVKGLNYLIRAALLVSKELEDFKVIIAGDGDLDKHRKMIEQHSQSFEIRNYFIHNKEAAELFQRASLIVLPYCSEYTAKSGVLSVAYAFSKPVVVTRVGALPEVVDHEHTGLLVPPDNVKALAKAITRLLKDGNLRKKIQKNIRKKVKNELSPDKIAESTLKVYEKAIQLRSEECKC